MTIDESLSYSSKPSEEDDSLVWAREAYARLKQQQSFDKAKSETLKENISLNKDQVIATDSNLHQDEGSFDKDSHLLYGDVGKMI